MKQINLKKAVGLAVLIFIIPSMAIAYGGQGRGKGFGPPQAAIDVCEGKTTGDAVEFTNRRNETVSGTCQDENGQLIAMPEGGHHGRGYGMRGRDGVGYGKGEWRGKNRQSRHEMRAEFLGLSDEQQEQIETIRTEERATHRELRGKMREYRDQLRELTDAGTFDEKAVRAIAEQKAKIQVELAVSKAQTRSRIHAIMTPEQQELAKDFRSDRNGGWGRHHRGGGGRW